MVIQPVKPARAPKDPAGNMLYISLPPKEQKELKEILHLLELENSNSVNRIKELLNLS